MPLDYTSRNMSAGGASPYIPMITNNPAFQVEIIPMDGRLEQKPGQAKNNNDANTIGVGDTIRGETLSGTSKKGEKVIGKIVAVETDNNTVTGYKILDKSGKEVVVDPSTATKMELNGEDPLPSAQQVQLENYTPQNYILLYEEWKSNVNQ